ncbi:MAG: hypothetical protein MUO76_23110 [Anaerolineaceae bacterium]|nr:hypothetical protein [Anaerolineaceae bacterium]
MKPSEDSTNEIIEYYRRYDEQNRLADNWGQIEFIRTQNIIQRYLKPPPQ